MGLPPRPREWYSQQLVARAGLGRAISMVIAEAEHRGAEQGAVVEALVDVLRSYTDHHGMVLDDLLRLVRDWAPASEKV
jgi:hypothetical protein